MLLSTNATLVCILSGIKKIYCNSVSIYLCICPVTDISASVTPIGGKVCPTVDLSFGYKVSAFGGDIFRCHQLRDQKWRGVGFREPFNREYLANGKSEPYMSLELNMQLDQSCLEM